MNERQYVIAGPVDDEDGTLYWSNKDGWVHLSTATVFSAAEFDDGYGSLPIEDDARWIELPIKENKMRLRAAQTIALFRFLTDPTREAGAHIEDYR